jgi:hypothetical protein
METSRIRRPRWQQSCLLNEDSHDRRSPAERAGAPIVLPGILNFSERYVLTCLLTSFGYEVAPSPDRVDVNV